MDGTGWMKKQNGTSRGLLTDAAGVGLIEILFSLAIFSVLMGAIYASFVTQTRQMTTQYRIAEAEMEIGIAKGIIERDLMMAGYGLADSYDFDNDGIQNFTPKPAFATLTTALPDRLYLQATGLSMRSRASQAWSYFSAVPGTVRYQSWSDPRENLRTDTITNNRDAMILIEPSTKKLLAQGGNWLFRFDGYSSAVQTVSGSTALTNPQVGTVAYGLELAGDSNPTPPSQPYYTVKYYRSTTSIPGGCAPGTFDLMRAESDRTGNPTGGDRILSCVLDFQVAFGLDTNDDGVLDFWDDNGAQLAGYSSDLARKRLKQIRVYILTQYGKREEGYTYSLDKVRVGEGTTIGRDMDLTTEQRRYRWKLLTLFGTMRNVR